MKGQPSELTNGHAHARTHTHVWVRAQPPTALTEEQMPWSLLVCGCMVRPQLCCPEADYSEIDPIRDFHFHAFWLLCLEDAQRPPL